MRRATRQLPVDPDTFDGEIVAKHATNGSDVNFLKQKFRQTFHAGDDPRQEDGAHERARSVARRLAHLPDRHVTLLSAAWCTSTFPGNEAIASTLEPFAAPPRLSAVAGRLHVRRLRRHPPATSRPLQAARPLSVWVRGARRHSGASRKLARPRDGGHGGVPWASGRASSSWRGCQSSSPSTLATRSWTPRPSHRAAVLSGGGGLGERHCAGAANDGQVVENGTEALGREGGSEWRRGGSGPRRTAVTRLLFRLSSKTSPTLVELLLGAPRADVEKATHDGFTPLLVSAQNGNLKITEFLLEKRADTNKADKRGQTPLHMAAYFGHKDVVMTLLAAGPDKAVTTASGWTALSIARRRGHDEIAALLE